MRAFIKDDHRLFHERRVYVGCEGWADPGLAYQHFRSHAPLRDDSRRIERILSSSRPARIESVSPPRKLESIGQDRFSLMLNYGASESVFVEIITSASNGTRFLSRIEVLKSADWSRGIEKPIPTGSWRARFASNDTFRLIPAHDRSFTID